MPNIVGIRSAKLSTSAIHVFSRMTNTLLPGTPIKGKFPAYVSNSCHSTVCKGIAKRNVSTDIVWLYGTDMGDVIHSVLSDKDSNVLIDTFHRQGVFNSWKGYDMFGDTLWLVAQRTVAQLTTP